MAWTRLRHRELCGGCPEERLYRIPVAAVAYITKAGLFFCEACGTRLFGPPPSDVPAYEPAAEPLLETSIASEFSRFRPPAHRRPTPMRPQALDARQRQAGERSDR